MTEQERENCWIQIPTAFRKFLQENIGQLCDDIDNSVENGTTQLIEQYTESIRQILSMYD